jgi:hypothetical protein
LVEKQVCRRWVQVISEKSASYRARAAHCRSLAEFTLDDGLKDCLLELAADFDEEAEREDAGSDPPL